MGSSVGSSQSTLGWGTQAKGSGDKAGTGSLSNSLRLFAICRTSELNSMDMWGVKRRKSP